MMPRCCLSLRHDDAAMHAATSFRRHFFAFDASSGNVCRCRHACCAAADYAYDDAFSPLIFASFRRFRRFMIIMMRC